MTCASSAPGCVRILAQPPTGRAEVGPPSLPAPFRGSNLRRTFWVCGAAGDGFGEVLGLFQTPPPPRTNSLPAGCEPSLAPKVLGAEQKLSSGYNGVVVERSGLGPRAWFPWGRVLFGDRSSWGLGSPFLGGFCATGGGGGGYENERHFQPHLLAGPVSSPLSTPPPRPTHTAVILSGHG